MILSFFIRIFLLNLKFNTQNTYRNHSTGLSSHSSCVLTHSANYFIGHFLQETKSKLVVRLKNSKTKTNQQQQQQNRIFFNKKRIINS